MRVIKDVQPKNISKPQIDINNFKIIKELQSGTSTSIYSVKNITTEKFFAAKVKKGQEQDEKIRRIFNNDFNNIIRCQHPTLLKYFGYSLVDFKGEKNTTIIMDLATNGSLSSFIDKAQNGFTNRYYKNARQIILIGIARGMMYLHEHHILHRNLNTSNVFLDEHYRPLIANYGINKISKSGQSVPQSLTYQNAIYMAPEVLSSNIYNIKSDVYSFGIIMFEILTDMTPYPLFQKGRMTTLQFVRKVINEDYRPKFTTPLKKSFKKLIEKCLSKNPHDRPSFAEIFNLLAYNIEDSLFDLPDEKEKDDNDHNYCLDNVDLDELFTYIDLISKNDTNNINESLKATIDDLKRDNELLKRDNEQMRQQISLLKKQNIQLAKKFEESFTKDITPLKNDYDQLKRDNEQLKKENDDMKKKIGQQPPQSPKRPEIPPLLIQKREEKPVVIEVEEEDDADYNSNSISESISTITFDDTTESNSRLQTVMTKKKKKEKSSSSSDSDNERERRKNAIQQIKQPSKIQQKDDASSTTTSSSDVENERKQINSLKNKSRLQATMPPIIKKKRVTSTSSSEEDDVSPKSRVRTHSLKNQKNSLNMTLRRIESKSDNEDPRDSYSPHYLKQSFRFNLRPGGKTSDNDSNEDQESEKSTKSQKEKPKIPLKKNERSSMNERELYYLKKNSKEPESPSQKTSQIRMNSPNSRKIDDKKQTTPTIRLNSPSRKLDRTKEDENKKPPPSPTRKSSDEDRPSNESQRKFFGPRYKPELLLHLSAKKNNKETDDDKSSTNSPLSQSSSPTPLIKKYERLTEDDRGPSSPRKKNDIYSQFDEKPPSSPRKRINDEERGLSSPRKKINDEERSINSPRNKIEKEQKLNSPRYKTENSIRLPKKVESPKEDEERELLSPRKRSESLRLNINKEEINLNDDDDLVCNSPRYKPPDFNETNIALDRFNGLPLKFQKTFISELIKKSPSKLNQDLMLIKELLRYLLQFNQSINSIHYFSVSTNRPKDSYASVNEWCQDINEVHLLSAATEILYLNNSLDSSDFIEIIKQFGSVSIEIKYPSENFEGIFEIASNIKNSQITKLKLAISISGIATVDEMFRKNKDINSVKLDSTVSSIGKNSFRSCSSLVYVSISNSVKSIGNDSFRKCSSLTQISIPNSVTSIGEGAFSKCNSLRSISIPNSVTYIGEWSFNECSSLKQISVPDSVAQIGEWAFSACSALKNFVIPKSVTVIGVSTFADCSALTKIVIPNSVTSLGNWCFCKCSALCDVSIPSSVVSIGEGAFSKCFALTDIEIPPKVTIIRTSTFAECSSLEVVTVPSSVTTIEDQAFAGCFSLNEISLPRSVASIGFWAFPSNTVITSQSQ